MTDEPDTPTTLTPDAPPPSSVLTNDDLDGAAVLFIIRRDGTSDLWVADGIPHHVATDVLRNAADRISQTDDDGGVASPS